MRIIDLNKILSDNLHKPVRYHYLCYGYGVLKLIDMWGNHETINCAYDCYDCKCKKVIKGSKELIDRERYENDGMIRIIERLKNDNQT